MPSAWNDEMDARIVASLLDSSIANDDFNRSDIDHHYAERDDYGNHGGQWHSDLIAEPQVSSSLGERALGDEQHYGGSDQGPDQSKAQRRDGKRKAQQGRDLQLSIQDGSRQTSVPGSRSRRVCADWDATFSGSELIVLRGLVTRPVQGDLAKLRDSASRRVGRPDRARVSHLPG